MNGWTLAFQAINFVILAAVLRRFLFQPVTRIVARRQADISAAAAEAARARQAAEQTRAGYESELAKLRAEREQMLEEARTAAAGERQRVLDQAARDAQALLDSARAQLAQERHQAERQLTEQGSRLGIELARRLLSDAAGAGTAEAFLERLCRHLESLPAERARELHEQVAGAPAIVVAVAPALEPTARSRWESRIGQCLALSGKVQLVDDAALIAGAELRLPHTTFSLSWKDGLERARKEVLSDAYAG